MLVQGRLRTSCVRATDSRRPSGAAAWQRCRGLDRGADELSDELLVEDRRLPMVLAHQYVAQIEPGSSMRSLRRRDTRLLPGRTAWHDTCDDLLELVRLDARPVKQVDLLLDHLDLKRW